MGTMHKSTIIFGENHSVRLAEFKSMNKIKSIIKELYGQVPVNLSSANKLAQELKKKYQNDPSILETAYVKVGIVKKSLVFRVKNEKKPKFEKDAVLVKDIVETQDLYKNSKQAVRFHEKWLEITLSGSQFKNDAWAKELRKLFSRWESEKSEYKNIKVNGDLTDEKVNAKILGSKRRALSTMITICNEVMKTANGASLKVQKAANKMGIQLPNLVATLEEIAKRAGQKANTCKTLDGLHASVQIDVLTMTDKEFDNMIGH